MGYRKENSDNSKTKISYRRKFENCLEDKHQFKLPFSEEEKEKIKRKLSKNFLLSRRIIGSHLQEFKFTSPFKTEHLVRGKTQMETNINSIFENIRDPSKYTFIYKFDKMTADDTDKTNKTTFHNGMSQAQIQKLSKGSFKYLIRTYSIDMFDEHLKRLQKAKALFPEDQIKKALGI